MECCAAAGCTTTPLVVLTVERLDGNCDGAGGPGRCTATRSYGTAALLGIVANGPHWPVNFLFDINRCLKPSVGYRRDDSKASNAEFDDPRPPCAHQQRFQRAFRSESGLTVGPCHAPEPRIADTHARFKSPN